MGPPDLDDLIRAKSLCRGNLLAALDDGDHLASGQFGHLHQHQPQRARADHRDRIADVRSGFLQPT